VDRRIKLTLIFLLFYIFAFFTWWTFSLIKLSKEKHDLLLQNAELKAKTSCMMLRKKFMDTSLNTAFSKADIEHYAIKNCPDLKLVYDENGLPDFKIGSKVIAQNKKWYKKECTKYLLEGITMFFAIAAGVFWIFLSLGRILNLSKQQNNFLLSVSHELKTPITAIRLVGQTLSTNYDKLSIENKKSLLEKIDFNTDRLNNLIDQMLLLTRLEGAQYKKTSEKIELKEMLLGILKRIPERQKSPFNVITKIEDNLFIEGDRLTLEICFSNLIENAFKYSPSGGDIVIAAYRKPGKIMVSIADNGVGIKGEDKKRVFEKFYRVGNENTRETKGTGLGLYLVKQILQLHKGSIKISDNQPNGAIFAVNLKG